jgi:hypothetical protein
VRGATADSCAACCLYSNLDNDKRLGELDSPNGKIPLEESSVKDRALVDVAHKLDFPLKDRGR